MSQQALFDIDVKQLIPNAEGTADLRYFAIGEDGHEYAAKEVTTEDPNLPAAEYLGYCLSAVCQIAVPAIAKLIMPDGTLALGSRFEGGVSSYTQLNKTDQLAALKHCKAELSALLTLDVFLANNDRHGGNFLLRQSTLANAWSMTAIDFSRAMWKSGFPSTPITHTIKYGNTADTITYIKDNALWDNGRSMTTCTALNGVTAQQYQTWVSAMPTQWVKPDVTASISWWATPARAQRIADLGKHL